MKRLTPGQPVPVSLLHKMQEIGEMSRPPASGVSGKNILALDGGTAETQVEDKLYIFKITGTTTGGYTFQEVYDPDADGTYATDTQGLVGDSTTKLVLVPSTGVTPNTNDLVFARRNPKHPERFEVVSYITNVDDLIPDASPTISGKSNISDQAFAGRKDFVGQATGIGTSGRIRIAPNVAALISNPLIEFIADPTIGNQTVSSTLIVTDSVAPTGAGTVSVVQSANINSLQLIATNILTAGDASTDGFASITSYASLGVATDPDAYTLYSSLYGVSGLGSVMRVGNALVSGVIRSGIGFAASGTPTLSVYVIETDLTHLRFTIQPVVTNATSYGVERSGTDYSGADAVTGGLTFKGGLYISGVATSPPPGAGSITNTMLANMPAHTFKGNNTGSAGVPLDLTVTQATAELNAFVASGAGHLKGLVPDPGAVAGTTKFLREDATWATPPATTLADGDYGDITVGGTGTTLTIDNAAVSYAKIQNIAALSVFGRASNSAGVGADITAVTDGHVLRLSGTTLGFGTIVTAGIANAAVTYAKIQSTANQERLLGQDATAAGAIKELANTYGIVFNSSAGVGVALTSSDVTGTNTSITGANDVLQDVTGLTVTLPAAGDYLVYAVVRAVVGNTGAGAYMWAQFMLNGTLISSHKIFVAYAPVGGVTVVNSVTLVAKVTATGAHVLKVQAARNDSGSLGIWNANDIQTNSTNGQSRIGYMRAS